MRRGRRREPPTGGEAAHAEGYLPLADEGGGGARALLVVARRRCSPDRPRCEGCNQGSDGLDEWNTAEEDVAVDEAKGPAAWHALVHTVQVGDEVRSSYKTML